MVTCLSRRCCRCLAVGGYPETTSAVESRTLSGRFVHCWEACPASRWAAACACRQTQVSASQLAPPISIRACNTPHRHLPVVSSEDATRSPCVCYQRRAQQQPHTQRGPHRRHDSTVPKTEQCTNRASSYFMHNISDVIQFYLYMYIDTPTVMQSLITQHLKTTYSVKTTKMWKERLKKVSPTNQMSGLGGILNSFLYACSNTCWVSGREHTTPSRPRYLL